MPVSNITVEQLKTRLLAEFDAWVSQVNIAQDVPSEEYFLVSFGQRLEQAYTADVEEALDEH